METTDEITIRIDPDTGQFFVEHNYATTQNFATRQDLARAIAKDEKLRKEQGLDFLCNPIGSPLEWDY